MSLVDFSKIWNKCHLEDFVYVRRLISCQEIFIKNILLYLQFTNIVENINFSVKNLKINWILGLSKF